MKNKRELQPVNASGKDIANKALAVAKRKHEMAFFSTNEAMIAYDGNLLSRLAKVNINPNLGTNRVDDRIFPPDLDVVAATVVTDPEDHSVIRKVCHLPGFVKRPEDPVADFILASNPLDVRNTSALRCPILPSRFADVFLLLATLFAPL
jgi:hypothetical protein